MGMVAGRSPAAVAVKLAVPASALVITVARVEIEPAEIVTYEGTDTSSELSDVSWTIVSDVVVAGDPDVVSSDTSRTLYTPPSDGRAPGLPLAMIRRPSLEAPHEIVHALALLTVTNPAPVEYPVEVALITAVPGLVVAKLLSA